MAMEKDFKWTNKISFQSLTQTSKMKNIPLHMTNEISSGSITEIGKLKNIYIYSKSILI